MHPCRGYAASAVLLKPCHDFQVVAGLFIVKIVADAFGIHNNCKHRARRQLTWPLSCKLFYRWSLTGILLVAMNNVAEEFSITQTQNPRLRQSGRVEIEMKFSAGCLFTQAAAAESIHNAECCRTQNDDEQCGKEKAGEREQ